MINSYLEQAQLNVEQQLINAELEKLEQYLNSNAAPAVRWQYQIPELGEGGAALAGARQPIVVEAPLQPRALLLALGLALALGSVR